ncbi:XRE family transcriptional regulator [Amycolatopsis mediterranei S699]|uniref:XRE family transcriptional regulator n=2 Tax=Amycolatopsis mediterranei TaxID=33910 RepID=A0A0H3DAB9_AMYMU|nr:helix-turn-helix transcriptional regulator [Amycolatopsis mediterranei]ADJ47955.1 XRE family transcriptional regulator [Amycolatopsis mediterranei U32]AEK44855.1 XRE family transcriptional regulator [Amycolatopsis mediterranei S699]AFO79666.1 XRE family transcriptional regulator [Amycolatopsis mediterranei S699]AGT86794.1 XRE family transcriptional regulator [Amycolatopsis mediterranei RB]KDO10776.1 XRE family transcriptional regulator [Amycolatopsis mediterranei]
MDSTFDAATLGAFLRTRRAALQPEDVGLRRGHRRRAPGLRREEVAQLCSMSADYFARLERGDGPQPSEPMLAAVARGLRLTPGERDHLFLLAGYRTARRDLRAGHVSPGLMRVMDRIADTPAQVMGPLGETLLQTPSAVALLGEQTQYTGHARSAPYRWFTDPAARERYHPGDHARTSRVNVAQLRAAVTRDGPRSPAAELVAALRGTGDEFDGLWERHEVGLRLSETKRFVHPEIGRLDLYCQLLLEPDEGQSLLIFTATPGTEDQEKLALLTVVGTEEFSVGTE